MMMLMQATQSVNPLERGRRFGFGTGSRGAGGAFEGELDDFADDLAGAWLPFRGFTGHLGPCCRVRDTGDASEQDVGFGPNGWMAGFSVGGAARVRWWYDQSGAAKDLGQGTALNQPGLVVSGIGGRPSLSFDGATSFLTTAGTLSFAGGLTLYVVLEFGPDGDWQTFWCVNSSISTRMRKRADTQRLQFTSPVADTDGTADLGVMPVLVVCQLGATKRAWVNNTLDLSAAVADTASAGVYRVGVDGSGSWFLHGRVAAVLAYDAAHDDATRDAIQSILAGRFGITL